MKKRYFICVSSLRFSDYDSIIRSGKWLVLTGKSVHMSTGGSLKEISSQGDWMLNQLKAGRLKEGTKKEFEASIKEAQNKKVVANKATTTYQEITTTVSVDDRIKKLDAHGAFSQSLASPSILKPPKSARNPNIETHIKMASPPNPFDKKTAFSGGGSKIVEPFAAVEIPENKRANKINLAETFQQKKSNGLVVIDTIDMSSSTKDPTGNYKSKWEEYLKLRKKVEKVSFLEKLTYPDILQFFIERTTDLLASGEANGKKLTANIRKMHENLISIMEGNMKLSRMAL